jgi:molybdopterin synthase catalytic subunit
MLHIKIQTEDFDVGAEIAALTAGRTDIGGIGCFVGTVRADAKGSESAVTGMTLEHYPGMTERAIAKIADQAVERWPLLGCTVIHWLKTKAPFWKREDFASGDGAWVDARDDDDIAASRWN